GDAQGPVVVAGWGIVAPDLGVDDYQGLDVHGKVVAVRRFTPKGGPFSGEAERRYGDLPAKAFTARQHGALGPVAVDVPPVKTGEPLLEDAPLPKPALDAAVGQGGDAGIPVALLTRVAGAALLGPGEHRAALHIRLTRRMEEAANVVGRLP